jgi:hypothetical protein
VLDIFLVFIKELMGIVKLMLPRFMFYRRFMPMNRDWRKNTFLGVVQIFTLGNLLFFAASRYSFRSALRGVELIDPEKRLARAVPVL